MRGSLAHAFPIGCMRVFMTPSCRSVVTWLRRWSGTAKSLSLRPRTICSSWLRVSTSSLTIVIRFSSRSTLTRIDWLATEDSPGSGLPELAGAGAGAAAAFDGDSAGSCSGLAPPSRSARATARLTGPSAVRKAASSSSSRTLVPAASGSSSAAVVATSAAAATGASGASSKSGAAASGAGGAPASAKALSRSVISESSPSGSAWLASRNAMISLMRSMAFRIRLAYPV